MQSMPGRCAWANFYPRPPRGGRRQSREKALQNQIISIHALREEGDRLVYDPELKTTQFLSTPSARRATDGGLQGGTAVGISIHALREEGDREYMDGEQIIVLFLSTPSARRATKLT